MKLRIIGTLVAVGGALGFAAACAENPPQPCLTGHGDYAAKYTLQSGTGACAELAGEPLGVNKFPQESGNPRVGLLPAGANVETATQKVGFGVQKTLQAENDFCLLETPSKIDTEIPAVTEENPDGGEPVVTAEAVPVGYEFTDVRFFTTPGVPGTVFDAKLRYTQGGSAACEASYTVVALYPAVPCFATDENGEPVLNTDGTYVTDELLCDPNRDVDAGRILGSGINPDFKTFCDGKTGLCQLVATEAGPGILE